MKKQLGCCVAPSMHKFIIHRDRLIHSIKTALAVLMGFLFIKIVHFHVDQWLIITILVVMCAQMNVGSILQKSYMRFLGTLAGSLIAVCTLTFFGNNYMAAATAIAFAALFFSYMATSQKSYSDAGTLGVVTVAIILIGQNPTITTAAERFLEISIGILIAALVSQFVLPIHARRHLRDNQAKTIHLLRQYYLATFCGEQHPEITKKHEAIDEEIVKLLIAQRKLATEATREILSKAYDLKLFKQSLWCEKEILRSITFMYHAYQASSSVKKYLDAAPSLNAFHEKICKILEEISQGLANNKKDLQFDFPSISSLKEYIYSMNKNFDNNEVVYTSGFLFCAEILIQRIESLTFLIGRTSSSYSEKKQTANHA